MKKKKNNIVLMVFLCLLVMMVTIIKIRAVRADKFEVDDEILSEVVEEISEFPLNEETIEVDLQLDEIPLTTDMFDVIFTEAVLDDDIYLRINNISFKENVNIQREDLRYLEVTHWGFDGKPHYGELISHKAVSKELLDIFKELYDLKYPIEKINLVDEYSGDDNLSMEDNNTSAFNYREIAGTKLLSNHGYGLAVDINPLQNPYVKGGIILPLAGKEYIDRNDVRLGMIINGDECYNAFVSRGWQWGGDWSSLKDYQHFEKKIFNINN